MENWYVLLSNSELDYLIGKNKLQNHLNIRSNLVLKRR